MAVLDALSTPWGVFAVLIIVVTLLAVLARANLTIKVSKNGFEIHIQTRVPSKDELGTPAPAEIVERSDETGTAPAGR